MGQLLQLPLTTILTTAPPYACETDQITRLYTDHGTRLTLQWTSLPTNTAQDCTLPFPPLQLMHVRLLSHVYGASEALIPQTLCCSSLHLRRFPRFLLSGAAATVSIVPRSNFIPVQGSPRALLAQSNFAVTEGGCSPILVDECVHLTTFGTLCVKPTLPLGFNHLLLNAVDNTQRYHQVVSLRAQTPP